MSKIDSTRAAIDQAVKDALAVERRAVQNKLLSIANEYRSKGWAREAEAVMAARQALPYPEGE